MVACRYSAALRRVIGPGLAMLLTVMMIGTCGVRGVGASLHDACSRMGAALPHADAVRSARLSVGTSAVNAIL